VSWIGCRSPEVSRVAFLAVLLALGAQAQQREQRLLQKYNQELRERSATLDSIKAELDRGRALVRELREKEESSMGVLRQIDRNIALAQRYQRELSAGIDSLTARVDSLGASLGREQVRLEARQAVMRRRLVSMYRVGITSRAAVLAAAGPVEVLTRALYFRRLKSYDESLVRSILQSKQAIETDKLHLELTRSEQQALLEERRSQQQRLVAERGSRETLLKQIQGERELHSERLAELEAAQKQLLVIIKQLESRKASVSAEYERSLSSEFEKRRGRLAWPVTGQVVGAYGKVVHPVYKTVTMSNGIDVKVRPGESVRCVAPGRVAYIGRMRGLGRLLMVDHYGGYLTIYANLGAILVAQDAEVEFATVVGQAATTPSVAGEPVAVHFELRKSTDALDPMEWLEPAGM